MGLGDGIWRPGEFVRVNGDPPSDYARMQVLTSFRGLAWCRHLDSGRLFLAEENTLVWHPIPEPGQELMYCEVDLRLSDAGWAALIE